MKKYFPKIPQHGLSIGGIIVGKQMGLSIIQVQHLKLLGLVEEKV